MCKNAIYMFGITRRDCYFDFILSFPSFWTIVLCDATYRVSVSIIKQRHGHDPHNLYNIDYFYFLY